MIIVYAGELLPESTTSTIFLAGPSPRKDMDRHWRDDALDYLYEIGYDGAVLVPVPRDHQWPANYDSQIEWELRMMKLADKILFWVDRDLVDMPAFTTNVEFGYWVRSQKIVYGRPNTAPKNRYLDALYLRDTSKAPCTSLQDTINQTVLQVGSGAKRTGGERYIPLYVWELESFQNWYENQLSVGNRLRYAEVLWVFTVGRKVFSYAIHVEMYIASEDRYKTNEFILGRTDICSCVMIYPHWSGNQILLVSEYRSPVNNAVGKVYELPGGSASIQMDPIQVIKGEIEEETGILPDEDRIEYVSSRQLMATFSVHQSHLYVYTLTKPEYETLCKDTGIHGADDDERCSLHMIALKNLYKYPVDYSTIGMIDQAIQHIKNVKD